MINIVICGTPGTGKSTIVEKLKDSSSCQDINFVNLSKFAKDNDCIEEHDPVLDTDIVNEQKLLDCLLPILEEHKLNVIESIHGDILPSDIVNWVFVCRADNTTLYDRLKARNYNEQKLDNNIQAEIFQTVLDEVFESYGDKLLTELTNNDEEDLKKNVSSIEERIKLLVKVLN